jgi:hypothetical protein
MRRAKTTSLIGDYSSHQPRRERSGCRGGHRDSLDLGNNPWGNVFSIRVVWGGEGAAAKRKRRFPQPQPTARRPWAAADGRPGATCVLSLSVPAAAAPRIVASQLVPPVQPTRPQQMTTSARLPPEQLSSCPNFFQSEQLSWPWGLPDHHFPYYANKLFALAPAQLQKQN